MFFGKIQRELEGILQSRSRMAHYEIVHKELLLIEFLVHPFEPLYKLLV